MSVEFNLRGEVTTANDGIKLVYRCQKCFRVLLSMEKVVEHFANTHQITVEEDGFTVDFVTEDDNVRSTPTPTSPSTLVYSKFPAKRGYWNEDNRSICSTEDDSDEESWGDDILDRESVQGMLLSALQMRNDASSDKPPKLFDLPVAPASVKARALEKLQKEMERSQSQDGRSSRSKQAQKIQQPQMVNTSTSSTASSPQNKSQVKSKKNRFKDQATYSKSAPTRVRKMTCRFPAPRNHPGKQFACTLCSNVFRWKRTLFYHIKAAHNRNNLQASSARETRRRKHMRRTSVKGRKQKAVKISKDTDASKESGPSITSTAPPGTAIVSNQVQPPESQSQHQGSPSPPQDSKCSIGLLSCLWCPKRFPRLSTLQDHFYSEHKGQVA